MRQWEVDMIENRFDSRIFSLIKIHCPSDLSCLIIIQGDIPSDRSVDGNINIIWSEDPSSFPDSERIYTDNEYIILFTNTIKFKGKASRKFKKFGFFKIDNRIIFPSLNNPRWIFPGRGLYLLKVGRLVKPSRFIAKVAWVIMRLLYCLRLHKFLFPSEILVFAKDRNANYRQTLPIFKTISHAIGNDQFDFVLYTGVAGALMKFTAQVMDRFGKKRAFVKMGFSNDASMQIENEKKCLKELSCYKFRMFNLPYCLPEGSPLEGVSNWLVQSPAPLQFKSWTKKITLNHVSALAELFNKTKSAPKPISNQLVSTLVSLKSLSYPPERNELVYNICESIRSLLNIFKKIEINMGGSHGDFIPWNILVSKTEMFFFDWENYAYRTPGWDILNYILHVEIMVNKSDFKVIASRLIFEDKRYFVIIKKYLYEVNIDINLYWVCLLTYLVQIFYYYLSYENNQLENNQPLHMAPEFIQKLYDVYNEVLACGYLNYPECVNG